MRLSVSTTRRFASGWTKGTECVKVVYNGEEIPIRTLTRLKGSERVLTVNKDATKGVFFLAIFLEISYDTPHGKSYET
jgi:hypothetical protein